MDDLNQSSLLTSGGAGGQLGGIQRLAQKAPVTQGESPVQNAMVSFGRMLSEQMSEITHLEAEAGDAIQTYATGGDIALHDVMIAAEKAGTTLQLAMQMRNRMVSAYQEISRMNI